VTSPAPGAGSARVCASSRRKYSASAQKRRTERAYSEHGIQLQLAAAMHRHLAMMKGARILLVDDDEQLSLALCGALEAIGYTVTYRTSVSSAFAAMPSVAELGSASCASDASNSQIGRRARRNWLYQRLARVSLRHVHCSM
jgi:hypothetical protein